MNSLRRSEREEPCATRRTGILPRVSRKRTIYQWETNCGRIGNTISVFHTGSIHRSSSPLHPAMCYPACQSCVRVANQGLTSQSNPVKVNQTAQTVKPWRPPLRVFPTISELRPPGGGGGVPAKCAVRQPVLCLARASRERGFLVARWTQSRSIKPDQGESR